MAEELAGTLLLDAQTLTLLGGEQGKKLTLQWAWGHTSGVSLKYFFCSRRVAVVRVYRAPLSSELILSLNGRTSLPANAGSIIDLAGVMGGLIAWIPTNQSTSWEGYFPIDEGQQVYASMPIGGSIGLVVELL
jgi:hypothetical protein